MKDNFVVVSTKTYSRFMGKSQVEGIESYTSTIAYYGMSQRFMGKSQVEGIERNCLNECVVDKDLRFMGKSQVEGIERLDNCCPDGSLCSEIHGKIPSRGN